MTIAVHDDPAAEPDEPGAVATDREPDERRRGPRLPHVGAFDGLRGLAVAAVLLHHVEHLEGGYLGVDLFFVLSGYLITGLLLAGWREGGHVGLRTFWARRARRLAPALIITLIGTGLFALFISTPQEQHFVRWDGFATMFEFANWRAITLRTDYFAPSQFRSPLWHTWSLSIEEQLYLIWPLAVAGLLAWRRSAKAVLVAALGGAIVSAGLMIGLHAQGTANWTLYYGTHTRAAAVLLGASVAALRVVLGPRRWGRTRTVRHVLGAMAAIGLGVAWARLDGDSSLPYQGLLPLCSLAGAFVVASVADRRHPGPVGEVAQLPPLQFLGRISYGVYLFHFPLYLVIDHLHAEQIWHVQQLDGWWLIGLKVAVTIAAATISYVFVEQPIRHGHALQGRQARAALPAAAAFASIALLFGTLHAEAPPKFDPDAAVDLASTPGAPVVLLAGDSVPLVMGLEMTKERDALGISVANRGQPGCHLLASDGPIRGVEGNIRTDVADCAEFAHYRRVVRKVKPDVSMVLFGEFPNEYVKIDGTWRKPCEPEYLAAWKRRLSKLIDDLQVAGGPVVLVTAPGTQVSWIVDKVEPGMQERVDCTNQVLFDLAAEREHVGVVDLASFVCPPAQQCKEKVDGVDLREDGLHFKGAGAGYIASWLIPRVLIAAHDG